MNRFPNYVSRHKSPVSPAPHQRLTGDIEVRSIEVFPWGQRHIMTVLHIPVLAVAEVVRETRAERKREGVEI